MSNLARGRESFAQHAWSDAYRLLQHAEREAPLAPDDLERLADAAFLLGRDDESEEWRTRAHQMYVERGDHEAAARTACWLAFALMQRGARAPASGWFSRTERILTDAHLDSVVRGYLLIASAIQRIMEGDPAAGHDTFARADEIARRFGDPALASLACEGRGRALLRLGKIAEGVARLDEAMVAVIAGEVAPILAGDIYCSVLEGCQEIFDVRRSYEWTMSLARWCGTQQDLVRYRGECLLYRAEVMQHRGRWIDAARDAEEACALLLSRPAAGAAFYRIAEIHRLRGEHDAAEAAYTRANERGRKPQPGLPLLRVAQGRIDAAAASIRAALTDASHRPARIRMLPAAIEILLAAGDVEAARAAAAELSVIAREVGTPFLSAASAHASGLVFAADDDLVAASASLRKACELWRDLEMPFEAAQSCRVLAAICERRGDVEGHRLETDAARTLLEQIHTQPRPAADESVEAARPESTGPLSEREMQVLRLLAAGKTNRAIAEELFISEKTVARHVSNIFDKVGVSSRTGAAAWAFQRNLI
ncbi:MAG TPA: response regulator transcription factor [Vicinamibacterales bacterium]|nr:response regulator transcription factor [Vicinamibacterales bacterium]